MASQKTDRVCGPITFAHEWKECLSSSGKRYLVHYRASGGYEIMSNCEEVGSSSEKEFNADEWEETPREFEEMRQIADARRLDRLGGIQ